MDTFSEPLLFVVRAPAHLEALAVGQARVGSQVNLVASTNDGRAMRQEGAYGQVLKEAGATHMHADVRHVALSVVGSKSVAGSRVSPTSFHLVRYCCCSFIVVVYW